MNYIDIIILVAVLIGFLLGFKDGFVRKLIGIIGFIVAVIVAILLSSHFGRVIESVLNIEYYLAEIMAGMILFIALMIITTILKRVIHPFDKVNNLINQIIGGVVGVIQLMFFISAVFLLLNVFNFPDKKTQNSSFLYKYAYGVIPHSIDFLKAYTPDTEDIIKDYINQKDTLK
ncbi:MAG: CvpA family protein [Ignavibacterium sp.]|nr:CvpA family protein [Ignavibacterium sp.]